MESPGDSLQCGVCDEGAPSQVNVLQSPEVVAMTQESAERETGDSIMSLHHRCNTHVEEVIALLSSTMHPNGLEQCFRNEILYLCLNPFTGTGDQEGFYIVLHSFHT